MLYGDLLQAEWLEIINTRYGKRLNGVANDTVRDELVERIYYLSIAAATCRSCSRVSATIAPT
jgi:hypothetical protein